jgi:hypothetical protein
MTGGLGFTRAAISAQETNRSFLKHTENVRRKKDKLIYHVPDNLPTYTDATQQLLKQIRMDAQRNKRREEFRSIAIISTIIAMILLLLFAF